MTRPLTRRAFMLTAGGGLATAAAVPTPKGGAPAAARHAYDAFPHQDPELVRQVVQRSHFDADAVRELVADRPELAKASWDWGFGDWETPIGAAAHVGRPDIADILLTHGARPTLFTFAMLGRLEAVRAMIEAQPGVQRIPGPHGLSLLHHARAGGEAAAQVTDYLEKLGDADPQTTDLPLGNAQQAYLGMYELASVSGRDATGEGPTAARFQIVERRDRIGFQYGGEAVRDLLHQGGGIFHPVGAPAVRLTFEVGEGGTVSMEIRDGGTVRKAVRVG